VRLSRCLPLAVIMLVAGCSSTAAPQRTSVPHVPIVPSLAADEYRSAPNACEAVTTATIRRLVSDQPPPGGEQPQASPNLGQHRCEWGFHDARIGVLWRLDVTVEVFCPSAAGDTASGVATREFDSARWQSPASMSPVPGLGDQALIGRTYGKSHTAVLRIRHRNAIVEIVYASGREVLGRPYRTASMADLDAGALAVLADVRGSLRGRGGPSALPYTVQVPAPTSDQVSAVHSACAAITAPTLARIAGGASAGDVSPRDLRLRAACSWAPPDRWGILMVEVEAVVPAIFTGQSAAETAAGIFTAWRTPPIGAAGPSGSVSDMSTETRVYHVNDEVRGFARWRNLLVGAAHAYGEHSPQQAESDVLAVIRDALAQYGAI